MKLNRIGSKGRITRQFDNAKGMLCEELNPHLIPDGFGNWINWFEISKRLDPVPKQKQQTQSQTPEQ